MEKRCSCFQCIACVSEITNLHVTTWNVLTNASNVQFIMNMNCCRLIFNTTDLIVFCSFWHMEQIQAGNLCELSVKISTKFQFPNINYLIIVDWFMLVCASKRRFFFIKKVLSQILLCNPYSIQILGDYESYMKTTTWLICWMRIWLDQNTCSTSMQSMAWHVKCGFTKPQTTCAFWRDGLAVSADMEAVYSAGVAHFKVISTISFRVLHKVRASCNNITS